MKGEEFEYFGIRFFVIQVNGNWAYRVPGWCYEDNLVSSGEAITKAEDYIEENYYKILNS